MSRPSTSGEAKKLAKLLGRGECGNCQAGYQDQTTKKYAAISSNLYHVKLAWRNEVMHPKQTYTEEEALEVFAASEGAFCTN